uniref:Tonsoku-like protein n=1 Tax=Aceria tosichella TaxID=561515 RepID=A0A6G1SNL0_9ACAR
MSHLKEVNKFLKQINAAKLKKNHRECIELYNIVGGLCSEVGSYDEASHYHEQALDICKTIGDRLGTAVASRYIGEAKAALGNFFQAIDYIKRYLELAQQLKNKVEIQRAHTTLGRVYLMQAQELKDKSSVIDKQTKDVAREAEKRFQDALNLAESVRDQVDSKEYAQMISGLLINLGLIKEICGHFDEAVVKLNRAIEICRSAKLKEDLYRCQIILAGMYRQRNDVKWAVKTSEDALLTAKSIGKKLLICDALIERGLVRICQRDFKTAKRTFAQAYLEKSPNEEDHSKAIRLTKLAYLIASTYEKVCKDNTPSGNRLKLCDKLGDLFVAVGNYKLAVEFYRRAFSDAKVCSKPKSELARILYSVAETYADDGQFKHALVCYEKELTYRDGNNSEQCQSLIKIAHMHEYLDHEPHIVCEAYEKALEKAGNEPKLMHNVLRYYVPYMKQKAFNPTRYSELEKNLSNLKSYPEVVNELECEDYEESNDLEDEITNVDDIITDDEDNDEVMMIGRRRAKGKFKPNEVGDTPLHEASIKGDLKRVKSLVAQGHEINPRDNAGWIPLHEACNHGHYEVAEFLIEHGADVNNRGLRGMSPLHDAATNGHYDIMRLLIKNGANVIALTDTGETVLSCLRDYKGRNYTTMSNSDRSEYKQMEAELLNVMDKCGFNLMAEGIKNLGAHASTSAESAHTTVQTEQARVREQKMDRLASSKPSVREYRDAIVTLKRKRPINVDQEQNKRATQPATVQSDFSTSIPTKQWLLDDNIVEEEDGAQDDDDLIFLDESQSPTRKQQQHQQRSAEEPANRRKESHQQPEKPRKPPIEEPQDDDELEILDNNPETPRAQSRTSFPESEESQAHSMKSSHCTFNWNEPLVVTIEGRRLLVPIKDEYMTIGELKKSIVERYSVLTQAKPKISLAPCSDSDCLLFDHDFCRDVIRGELMAKVESWQLGSMESTYLENCRKLELEPVDFVRLKLRDFDKASNKLNLSYSKFPRAHLEPVIGALARRDFASANFQGSIIWFETEKVAQDFIELALSTWNKLTRLDLKCSGLLKSHFELLCNSKSRLPELQYIDVSLNSIAYKSKNEFTCQVNRLRRQVCCEKLKRLDVRRNHLLFVKSIVNESATTASGNNNEPTASATGSEGVAAVGMEGNQATTFQLDISKALDVSDIEILADDQYDYTVYYT